METVLNFDSGFKRKATSVIAASKRSKRINQKWKDVRRKVTDASFTKNQCSCTPEPSPHKKKKTEETPLEDARILIEEWRLHKVQSPIELNHDDSIHHDDFEPFEFHGHWDKGGEATFNNNGYTATLRFQNRELPFVKGGPLHEDEYVFEQLHFHWSEDDHSGCEHLFQGRAYSMEVHVVHYNKKYKDFEEAQDKTDGIAVVGFFLQAVGDKENPCFSKLSTAVLQIERVNTTTSVPSDCLTWIKDRAHCKYYYTYQGSLTTEPYNESVTWIMFTTPIQISKEQVAHFRNMKSTPCEQYNIKKNVRPTQIPPADKKLKIYYARSHRLSE